MRISAWKPVCGVLCALLQGGMAVRTPAEAQVRLHGRVITEAGSAPIADARVVLTSLRGRRLQERVTDENGRFTFVVYRESAVQLEASRLGYTSAKTPRLYFDAYDFYQIEIRLDVEATLLAPLEVTARSASRPVSALAGFERRRISAPGVFLTREEIDSRRPGYVTDLLAMIPGVRLESSGRGSRRTVVMGNAAGNPNCAAQVYVDGFLMNRDPDFAIDDVVTPQSVHGIEVYRGLSTVPADFLSPSATCGVVVIWTRRGARG